MDRRQDLIRGLQKGLDNTVCFFKALSSEQLDRQIYHDGARWTARQVMAHLITIEKSMHRLFNDLLSGGEGSPRDFDVDRFNKSQTAKLEGVAIEDLIDQFKGVRRQTIAMVESMTERDLDRTGHHAYHGQGRLERFIRWAYEHALLHEVDIQKILGNSLLK